jgi:Ca2+-binding EF-hand superfamily protein
MFDTNGDGQIDRHELKEMFSPSTMRKLSTVSNNASNNEDLWSEIMTEVDKNEDDEISYEEFNDALTIMLKKHMAD